MFLTGTGGLLDEQRQGDRFDQPVSTEYEHLMAQPWINGGMRVKIEQIKRPAGRPAAGLVGVDHPAGRTGEGAVHAQGLGHAGAARRAGATCIDDWDDARPGAPARADRSRASAARWSPTISSAPRLFKRLRQRELPRRADPDPRRTASPTSTSSRCSTMRRAKASAAPSGRSCARRIRSCSGARATATSINPFYYAESRRLLQAADAGRCTGTASTISTTIERCVAHCAHAAADA